VRIGLGLPTAQSPPTGRLPIDWAVAAEERGFSSVAVIDRMVAPTYDPLTALAAAAAVTGRVRLLTAVLLSPLRTAAQLASQAATVDQLSGGRLDIGLGVGSRREDYAAAGVAFERRGRILDAQLAEIRATWDDCADFAAVGPAPATPEGPALLIGGTSAAAVRRVVGSGDGWICGRGGAVEFARTATEVCRAWDEAGRPGRPRLLSVVTCAVGPDATADRDRHVGTYYRDAAFLPSLMRTTPVSVDGVRRALDEHRAAGCDEVVLLPCSADPRQVDHLAELL